MLHAEQVGVVILRAIGQLLNLSYYHVMRLDRDAVGLNRWRKYNFSATFPPHFRNI